MTIFLAEKYQEFNEEFDELGFQHNMFLGVDPAVKLEHSWNKLREIYKGLMKSYSEVYENHEKVVIMMTLKTLLVTAVSYFTCTCGWQKNQSFSH
jgi:hypothetical protein